MRKLMEAAGAMARAVVSAEPELPAADPAVVREILVGLGYPAPMDPVGLAANVREFQHNVGLPADGVAGPRTVRALAAARAAMPVARAAAARSTARRPGAHPANSLPSF